MYYFFKNLTLVELNYTVTEKEFLVVIYVVNKFQHYITGYTTFVHTDHSSIRYLINKNITLGWIRIWLLLFQEFDITIVDKLGKDNVVENLLCRLNITNEYMPVEDIFMMNIFFQFLLKSLGMKMLLTILLQVRYLIICHTGNNGKLLSRAPVIHR